MRLMPRSLGGQLLALVLGALVLAQGITVVLFMENRRESLMAAAREQVLVRAEGLVRLVEDTPADMHARILDAASGGLTRFSVGTQAVVAPGRTVAFAAGLLAEVFGDREVRAEMRWRADRRGERRDEGEEAGEDDDGEDDRARVMHGTRAVVALSVRLADGRWLNVEAVQPPPPAWAWATVVSTLLVGLFLIAGVALSVRRITRPLRALAAAADGFGRGQADGPIPASGPREVRRVIETFNAMQARVSRFVADRTRMLAAISHDLRTPLTTLRLRAEFVDDEETRERIIATVDEMTRMTEATLAFARDDAAREPTTPQDLSELARAVAGEFAALGASVPVEGAALVTPVRPVALRRALRNLVENALRYGGAARITVARRAGEAEIAVDDDGPGIPVERMEDVFEPFVRLEASRNEATGGVGLGLSTARGILRAHGGDIVLENRAGGGLRASMRLPLAG